jgi:TM2 domain-containing membrane protein YozV
MNMGNMGQTQGQPAASSFSQPPPQPQAQTYPNQKSKLVAGLLAIIGLGMYGVHNFYLGFNGKAILQLLLGTVGWIIIIGPVISGIWGLIEGIMILCTPNGKDAKGIPLKD